MSGANQGAAEAPNWFDEWAMRTPVITRYTLLSLILTSLLGWATGTSQHLLNFPFAILQYFQVWRLLTAPLVQSSILGAVFVIISFGTMGKATEIQRGSLGFFALMVVFGLLINIAYVVIMFAFELNPIFKMSGSIFQPSGGFWTILLAMIGSDCRANPDAKRRFFILPVQIPNRYYPWLLIAVFSLFSGGVLWDLVCSVVVGYLYHDGLLDRVLPSASRLQSWESGRGAWLASRVGFISLGNAGQPMSPPPGPGDSAASSWVSRSGGDVYGRGSTGATAPHAQPSTSSSQPSFQGKGQSLAGAAAASQLVTPTRQQPSSDARRLMAAAAQQRLQETGRSSSTQSSSRQDKEAHSRQAWSSVSDSTSDSVGALVALGFDRDAAKEALNAASGNLELAIDLLSS